MDLSENYWDTHYKTHNTGWDIGHIATPLKTYFDQLKNIPVIVRENLDSTFKPLRNFSPGMIVVPDQRKKRHYSFVKVKFEQPEWPFMVEGISI